MVISHEDFFITHHCSVDNKLQFERNNWVPGLHFNIKTIFLYTGTVSNLGFGFAGGKSPLHLKSRGDFSNGRGIFFPSRIRYENHKICLLLLTHPFWHEFRIRGGCRLRFRCWRHCFRTVNYDNRGCTYLSSRWCRSRLEKSSNWRGKILIFAGFSAILITAVYIVWFPDVIRRDTAITYRWR